MSVSADVLGVCGRSDCHLRRAQRRMVRPQARAPLPPSRRRGSGSGPLADGTPPSPRHSSYVRRPHRLSVAGSHRPAGRAGRQQARLERSPAAKPAATTAPASPPPSAAAAPAPAPTPAVEAVRADTAERTVTVDNGVVRAVFSNRGATLVGMGALALCRP